MVDCRKKRNKGKAVCRVRSTSKKRYRQTGKRKSVKADRRRKAKAPGWRKSRSGRRYFETRKNRSDQPGSRL